MADTLVEQLSNLKLTGLPFSAILVDTKEMLKNMVSDLKDATELHLDFEGVDLCKTGKVCLGQFHASDSSKVYVVDFITLDDPLNIEFDGISLATLLTDESIVKLLFDPRNDIDAIAHQFKVIPKGVICLQLAEVAKRRDSGHPVRLVFGQSKVMDNYLSLPYQEKRIVMDLKNKGKKLFAPELGGSYSIFADRPLDVEIIKYGAIDVYYFSKLRKSLFDPLPVSLKEWVKKESNNRVLEHQKSTYLSHGRQKALAPRF